MPTIAGMLEEGGARFPYRIESIFRKDSLDITNEDRALIRQRVLDTPEDRILITHGTDTMAETGRALAGIAGKTIILVGSLTPSHFKNSDATFNIAFAIGALQCLPPGVYVAMNGRVFDPFHVRKNREAGVFEVVD